MEIESRDPKLLTPHPISLKLYGELNTDGLKERIREDGILVPLVIKEDNTIVSGCRRWKSAMELELDTVPVELKSYATELEEKIAILDYNRYRDKNFSQKMNEAELIEWIVAEEAKQRQREHGGTAPGRAKTVVQTFAQVLEELEGGKTRDIVAVQIGLGSGETYRKAKFIWNKFKEENKKAKELVKQLNREVITISRAYKELDIESRNRRKKDPPLPEGIYNVIYADPPWQYENVPLDRGAAELHYRTKSIDEICSYKDPNGVPIQSKIADNAVLFLWVTNSFLDDALKVVEAWGFEYKTNMVWVKLNLKRPGFGFWRVRGRHELLYICSRGAFTPDQTGKEPISSVIEADAQEHSKKPGVVYEIIEKIYPKLADNPDSIKYLELFARNTRPNWASWGDEIQNLRRKEENYG